MLSPSHILHVAHPYITTAYIKQDVQSDKRNSQILVLETDIDVQNSETEEDKYFELLSDLKDIKSYAEKQFGNITRVDIRSHAVH